MKSRIAIWACVGALVAIGWRLYVSAIFPLQLPESARALIDITCPIVLLRQHPMTFYFVLLVNAGTYALIGVVVEMIRRRYRVVHDVQLNRAN